MGLDVQVTVSRSEYMLISDVMFGALGGTTTDMAAFPTGVVVNGDIGK